MAESSTELQTESNARLESPSNSSLESEAKRFKPNDYGKEHPLEERLLEVLCCVVCLDLPNNSIYQCSNGHLMCVSCLNHLLADSRIKDEDATCPQCRCEISRTQCIRNLAVEKAVSELPAACGFCLKQMPRSTLANHEKNICTDRLVSCVYAVLGCKWLDKHASIREHKDECSFAKKLGEEIALSAEGVIKEREKEVSVFKCLHDLLSSEKVTHIDILLRPYRTDEYIPKLYYESSRFSAHNHQWSVKTRVNESETRNPLHSFTRTLSYQLCLKSKPSADAITGSYVMVKGPYGIVSVHPVIHEFEFTSDKSEAPYKELVLAGATDCNKLLAAKTISLRLIITITTNTDY